MMMAVQAQPGVFFDLRYSLIAMAGLFGGPVSLTIASTISAICRFAMGCNGMVLGLSAILGAALVSAAFRVAVAGREENLKGRGRVVVRHDNHVVPYRRQQVLSHRASEHS
jgi:hypothetical protein